MFKICFVYRYFLFKILVYVNFYLNIKKLICFNRLRMVFFIF